MAFAFNFMDVFKNGLREKTEALMDEQEKMAEKSRFVPVQMNEHVGSIFICIGTCNPESLRVLNT